jgi:photosystem II stability/assembly factor-like uncharacterized protein
MVLLGMASFAADAIPANAQWEIQTSGTTASLRGVHSLGGGVAWASGTGGTVLRTEDGGLTWQSCATPPAAEKLDFRGVQAFDRNTAIVMSSGKGDLSRLYKTTDGCRTWRLLFTNPEKDGFWDALVAVGPAHFYLLGDPVGGSFEMLFTRDSGATWARERTPPAKAGEGAFAASNSSLLLDWAAGLALFGGGSPSGPQLYTRCPSCGPLATWTGSPLPLLASGQAAGIFSLAHSDWKHVVAVGGDYTKPDTADGTAAFTSDAGHTWRGPQTAPHGYRSAVAYEPRHKLWITVGPNGTDVSTDGGRNWRALKPTPSESPDADRDWNALSLPFVVGPHGRIGRIRADALPTFKP